MWKVDIVRLDYDDYPTGMPKDTIGPFDTYEDANVFLEDAHPYTFLGVRSGLPIGYDASINVLTLTSPEDYKKGLSV